MILESLFEKKKTPFERNSVVRVGPRYNEPVYNEDPDTTNDTLQPTNLKLCRKEARCKEHILSVPWGPLYRGSTVSLCDKMLLTFYQPVLVKWVVGSTCGCVLTG